MSSEPDELASEMRRLAERLPALDSRFDFSISSLDVLEEHLSAPTGPGAVQVDTPTAAAYLGEVLLRARPDGRWTRSGVPLVEKSGDPATKWDQYVADVYAQVRHFESAGTSGFLKSFVTTAIRYLEEPSDKRLRELGMARKYRVPSIWDLLMNSLRKKRSGA